MMSRNTCVICKRSFCFGQYKKHHPIEYCYFHISKQFYNDIIFLASNTKDKVYKDNTK